MLAEERPPARPTPFPCRRQLDLLQRMALRWTTRLELSKQGLRGKEERLPGARQVASIIVEALE
jgi:hypothetical protein